MRRLSSAYRAASLAYPAGPKAAWRLFGGCVGSCRRWPIAYQTGGPPCLSRLARNPVPVESLQTRPSASGIDAAWAESAASQLIDDPRNRAAKSGRNWVSRARFLRVPRTTNKPRTRHGSPEGGASRLPIEPSRSSRPANSVVFASSPRNAAPTSSSQSQISTTAASRTSERTNAASMARDRQGPGSIASSGRATQPPREASSTNALWRRRCSISRGRSAPGARSRKPTNRSPSTAATHAHVSMDVFAPWPRSSALIRLWETPTSSAS